MQISNGRAHIYALTLPFLEDCLPFAPALEASFARLSADWALVVDVFFALAFFAGWTVVPALTRFCWPAREHCVKKGSITDPGAAVGAVEAEVTRVLLRKKFWV